MLDRDLDRATDVAFEAASATAVHLGRIVKLVSTAVGRAVHEVADLVLIYQDLASELSKSNRGEKSESDIGPGELHWRATEYRVEPSFSDPRRVN